MLAAKQPLVVPMLLRLSHFKLSSYVVLVISKQKGITLVFKTDPLQNVDINSSFDGIAVIQKFIQGEIEGQLRQMFREDLPGIIHRLSQQWVKATVEAPYLSNQPPPSSASHSAPDPLSHSLPDLLHLAHLRPHPLFSHPAMAPPYYRPRSVSGLSAPSSSRRALATGSPSLSQHPPDTAFSDADNFAP